MCLDSIFKDESSDEYRWLNNAEVATERHEYDRCSSLADSAMAILFSDLKIHDDSLSWSRWLYAVKTKANCLEYQGHYDVATSLLFDAIDRTSQRFSDSILYLGHLYLIVGIIYDYDGQFHHAQTNYEKAFHIWLTKYGLHHQLTLDALHNIGIVLHLSGKLDSSILVFNKVLDSRIQMYGEDHQSLGGTYSSLSNAHRSKGDLIQSLEYINLAIANGRKNLGDSHPRLAQRLNNLASIQVVVGNYNAALQAASKSYEIKKDIFGSDHYQTASSLSNLGTIYILHGLYDEAVDRLEQSLDIYQRVSKTIRPEMADIHSNLGSLYLNIGKLKKAELHLEKALQQREQLYSDIHEDMAISLAHLGQLRAEYNDQAGATLFARASLDMKLQLFNRDHPSIANSLVDLGMINCKFDQVESGTNLMVEAYDINRAQSPINHSECLKIALLIADQHCQLHQMAESDIWYQKSLDHFRELSILIRHSSFDLKSTNSILKLKFDINSLRLKYLLAKTEIRPDPNVLDSTYNLGVQTFHLMDTLVKSFHRSTD
jgi:tetratricopeptide (TPR) repeat protein